MKRFEKTGLYEAKKPPGRPRKTTARDDKWITLKSKKDQFATATDVSKKSRDYLGIKVSRHTVSQRLNKEHLIARAPSTKPFISKKNQLAHKKFATEHITWTKDQWSCVYFSDESKFSLFGSDGRRYVRGSAMGRYSFMCIRSSVKFGGGGYWCLV